MVTNQEKLCQQRRSDAEQNYLDAGLLKGFKTVPGATLDDWGHSDQSADCYLPAYNYIPRASVQYALALSEFDDQQKPLRFRFGIIASSDNHAAMAGSGYKEFDRELMSESRSLQQDWLQLLLRLQRGEASSQSIAATELPKAAGLDQERYSSFTLTGGLVAVHSQSRSRSDIWQALKTREVYATSGPQILLWFDLIGEQQSLPMGSETLTDHNPSFEVRAMGSFKQKPGCPAYTNDALGAERVEQLCRGECFNPGSERYKITRIEVIRIRPQATPGEAIESLIEDPWRSFNCPADGDGCKVKFSDDSFSDSGHDHLYYVRAIQEPTAAINGNPFHCLEQDSEGQCLRYKHCNIFDEPDEQCPGLTEERAWSSPIFVDYAQASDKDQSRASGNPEDRINTGLPFARE